MGPNKLTIYDLTQPTEMHKDYNWWHILRNGDGLANVQNQHECIKIVKELQRQANEVHALRAEVERLRAEVAMYRSALANALEIALPMPQPPKEEE